MAFYDEVNNVVEYIHMAEGYDGRDLIALLKEYLPPGSTILELGMGPGKDLDLLAESYIVTGSDFSEVFLDLYRRTHPTADLLTLDAVTLETERTFDSIYSDKVLHHLTTADLRRSFALQRELLADDGLLMHSFWHGNGEDEHHGLRFVYYTEDTLLKAAGPGFEVVAVERYKEMEDDDSFYILLRKR